MDCSQLPPSGFTETNEISYEWCRFHVVEARKIFDSRSRIQAHLWSYRHDGTEVFSFDLHQDGRCYPMTLQATGSYGDDLTQWDFTVPDLTEALHIIGILKESLSLNVEIGRRSNEVNNRLLETPLFNKTNGRLKVIR
ncbi:hypothetical protein [Pseudoalteromonas luteoviolacea]|uniref:Uncharacterized protein n=1 Tax=Pseudoalteromonas luteoviolacea S4060-1 TaxID=1365257 RepID=A0A167KVF7_9GAMM|nr:hypothetical protein [Pseudoalteromonas luteoviolacea]KZN63345.1 hypothetical protein N478_03585 [Pseudoalteromonas luteoviolacea S4060-1]